MKYFVRIREIEYEIEINDDEVFLNGERLYVDLTRSGAPELYSMLYNGRSFEMLIESARFQYAVTMRGDRYDVLVEDERKRRLTLATNTDNLPAGEMPVIAPIPGLIVKLLVEEGDEVEEGQPLVILEAMKMENEIKAVRAGTVKAILSAPGQRIEQNGVMLILE